MLGDCSAPATDTVRLFRGAELSPTGSIDLGDDADDVRLDTRTGNYGGGLWERRPGRDRSGQVFPLEPHSAAGSSREFSAGPRWATRLGQRARCAPDRRRRYAGRSGRRRAGGCLRTSRQLSDRRSMLPTTGHSGFPRSRAPRHLRCEHRKADQHRHDLRGCRRCFLRCEAPPCLCQLRRRERGCLATGRVSLSSFEFDQAASGARTSLFVPDLDRLFVAAARRIFRPRIGCRQFWFCGRLTRAPAAFICRRRPAFADGVGCKSMKTGIPLAPFASAVLFGASTPFASSLFGSVDPWLMAGLLYLGAGVGYLGSFTCRAAFSGTPGCRSAAAAAGGCPLARRGDLVRRRARPPPLDARPGAHGCRGGLAPAQSGRLGDHGYCLGRVSGERRSPPIARRIRDPCWGRPSVVAG